MLKVVSAAQMREMDRQTIEEFGMPGIVLMENAALRVVEVIAERFGPLRGKRIAVVCGKGNNGGDGLAIARHLITRFGVWVTVWLMADAAELSGDAALNYKMTHSIMESPMGTQLYQTPEAHYHYRDDLEKNDLIVDALFGTGLKGDANQQADIIYQINHSRCPILSVDVPSGLNADTGNAEGACVKATMTVTFVMPKFGLLVYPGAEYVGELIVADIGMPPTVRSRAGWPNVSSPAIYLTQAGDIACWLRPRVNGQDSNKGKFGHVTVIAGSTGFVGAPTLTAEAAARTGAGLVTLGVPEGLQNAAMARVSPVVMTRGLPQTPDGTFAHEAVEAALKLAEKGTAAALGPGLGGPDNEETRAFVREFVTRCPVPLVIDADALNCLAMEPDRGVSVVKARSAVTVLTPHPGEMGRLLGTDTATVQADRRSAGEQAARDYGCAVLLKGARTLIASPDGHLVINTTGNPGMATGGVGDVLTGIIAALLGSGLRAYHVEQTGTEENDALAAWAVAAAGAYLHGLAGDLAAKQQGGATGLIATDIVDFLPGAIAHCQNEKIA